ncbi:MAG: CfrBI family restriction endonuclease [Acidobacterium ailaaui]|nr:CfrBI family restriction endonuclease [Pseudacidobacterium ailaaui]
MSITLSSEVTKNIIKKLLRGEDYRIEVVTLINAEFLQYAIEFFKKIVDAKLKNENITADWYKKEFLDENLPSDEIAINSAIHIAKKHVCG